MGIEQAREKYRQADKAYQAWKSENPGVDAFTNPVGTMLATERDQAEAVLHQAR